MVFPNHSSMKRQRSGRVQLDSSPRIHQRCVVRPCLTHAGLVHEPKRDLLVRMGFGGGRYGVAKPLLAKAAAARPFRFG